jgi:ACS family hexuronate transporter-like MFS transporter
MDTDVSGKKGRYRWLVICTLLFAVTTINYMDRQVIGILKPHLQKDLGWSEIDYSNIVFFFTLAYAIGYPLAGRLMDKVGVRLGLAGAVSFWSLAIGVHGLLASVLGFSFARFALGLAEGANFPAAIKAVSEWFPKRERALATGIFNSGANVGALLTPIVVPYITVKFGWQSSFYVLGVIGLLWVPFWLWLYRNPKEHPKVSEAELRLIQSDPADAPAPKIPWLKLFTYRPVWAFVAGMFITAPIWWFYLYWVPDFFNKQHGLNLLELGPPIFVIYLMTGFGSIGGGWLSSWLIKRGWTVNAARKTAFLVCALCVVPVFAVCKVTNLWVAVGLIGLAAAAHSGFAANLFTLVSDTMPRECISSVVGIGGMAGSIGGMLIAKVAGYVLEWTGSYQPMFIIASSAYLIALAVIQILVPRWETCK